MVNGAITIYERYLVNGAITICQDKSTLYGRYGQYPTGCIFLPRHFYHIHFKARLTREPR